MGTGATKSHETPLINLNASKRYAVVAARSGDLFRCCEGADSLAFALPCRSESEHSLVETQLHQAWQNEKDRHSTKERTRQKSGDVSVSPDSKEAQSKVECQRRSRDEKPPPIGGVSAFQ